MWQSNQSFTIKLTPESIREIEKSVDQVCEKLFINDAYYGSILSAMTELHNLLLDRKQESFSIAYNTDYKKLNFVIEPVEKSVLDDFEKAEKNQVMPGESDSTTVFLIRTLADEISVEGQQLTIGFDISALHNEIYNRRLGLLQKYFQVEKGIKNPQGQ